MIKTHLKKLGGEDNQNKNNKIEDIITIENNYIRSLEKLR